MIKEKILVFKNIIAKNQLFVLLKDKLIFSAWILGIILLAGISWHLTQNARVHFLRIAVNQVLELYSDNLRVGELMDTSINLQSGTGTYFYLTNTEGTFMSGSVYIFSFMAEAVSFPCAAIIDRDGRVREYIALNPQGKSYLLEASSGLLAMYTRRIEGNNNE